MPTKSQQVTEALKSLGHEPNPKEIEAIANDKGCSKALVYKMIRRMPKPEPTGMPAPSEPVVKVAEAEEMEVPIEEMEVSEEQPPLLPPSPLSPKEEATGIVTEAILQGQFTEQQLTAFFEAVNEWIPNKYRKPRDTCKLLASVWVSPMNRYIKQIEEADLWIAIVVTIVVYAPAPIQYVMDKRKKGSQKSKELKE